MMSEKEKDINKEDINIEETEEVEETETVADEPTPELSETEKLNQEIESLKDKLMRHAAEFDNFKKRTQKEKEELYKMAVCDMIEKLLPVKDNMERAITSVLDADEKIAEGVKMIDKQFFDVLKEIGVSEIESVGKEFNPEMHNAVMHEDNEEYGENVITEEFMKGYMYKDKVIRHSVVKVAN